MNFSLTEEHVMIRDAARDFAQTELLPGVIERDNKQEFPDELVKKMGDLGFLGIMVDPKYGGSGMDTLSYVLIMEELSIAVVLWEVASLPASGSLKQNAPINSPVTSFVRYFCFCSSDPYCSIP